MHNFQIRFADSGFSQQFQNFSSIEMLQLQICNKFKIDKSNQKIISKKGAIITSTTRLDKQAILKRTYGVNGGVGDAREEMGEYMGMYLYSHREFMKGQGTEKIGRAEELSRKILNEKHNHYSRLQSQVYEFLEPLSKKFSQEQIRQIITFSPVLVPMAKQWQQKTIQLIKNSQTYKQDEQCLQEHIEKWEHQRKALVVLSKNLDQLIKSQAMLIQKLTQTFTQKKQKYQKLQMSVSMGPQIAKQRQLLSLKTQPINQSITVLQKQMLSLKIQCEALEKRTSGYKRNLARVHADLEKTVKGFDSRKYKKLEGLISYTTEMKRNYSELIQALKQKLQSKEEKVLAILANRQTIQKKFREYNQKGNEQIKAIQKDFQQLYKLYLEHQAMVKSEYRTYHEIFTQIEQKLKQKYLRVRSLVSNLHKNITELEQSSNRLQGMPDFITVSSAQVLTTITHNQQTQLKNRLAFTKKFTTLQSHIKQILQQQETRRQKFLDEMLSLNDTYDHPVLAKIRAPILIVNYDQSTDLEVVGKVKGGSLGRLGVEMGGGSREEFDGIDIDMYRENVGIDRILRQLQQVKNCQVTLKSQPTQSDTTKLKNLQALLQKSSDIFHRIYTHKLTLLTKQHSQSLHAHIHRITTLENENKELHHRIYSYTQNIANDLGMRKELEREVERLRKEVREMGEREGEMEGRVKRYEGMLEDNRKQLAKLKQDKKQIEQKITKEVSNTMQTLLAQLERTTAQLTRTTVAMKGLEEINQEYKIFMGDQAIKIETLEMQIRVYRQDSGLEGKDQMRELKDSFYGLAPVLKTQQQQQSLAINLKQPEPQHQHPEPQVQFQHSLPHHYDLPLLKKNSKSITTEQLKQIQHQITKLQKKIQQLSQQNQQLKEENNSLNEQIMKIAMKDMEDIEVQTEEQKDKESKHATGQQEHQQQVMQMETNVLSHLHLTQLRDSIRIDGPPQAGQLRIFLPYSPGLYIAIKTPSAPTSTVPIPSTPTLNNLPSQTRNYLTIHRTQLLPSQPQPQQQVNFPYILDMNCLNSKTRQLLTECTLVVVLRVGRILPAQGKYYVEGDVVAAVGFEDEDLGTKDYGPFLR